MLYKVYYMTIARARSIVLSHIPYRTLLICRHWNPAVLKPGMIVSNAHAQKQRAM